MNLGSLLRGVYHAITPWHDSGSVFSASSYQPKKKVLQPGDPGYVAPTPQPRPNVTVTNQPQIAVQRPENFFQGLSDNLRLPSAPNNTLTVNQAGLAPVAKPQPGAVIHPNQPAPIVKKPGIFDRITSGAKTIGQTAVGAVSNVPEVGLAAARAGTGIVQGVTQLPHILSAAAATDTKGINDAAPNRFTHALNTAAQVVNNRVKRATDFVNKPIDYANRGLDIAAKGYENRIPTAAGGAQVYKTEQVPINALAALLTLGGSSAAEASANGGRVSRVISALNKPLTSNPDNLISRTGQVVTSKVAPTAHAVNSPIASVRNAVTRLINSRSVPAAVERGAVDTGEIGNVLTDAQLNELTKPPTQIPVTQTGGGNVPIPVNTPRPGDIIREVGGDATSPATMPTPEEIATRNFNNQTPGRPDQNVEGVTPRTPEKPFTLDPKAVADSQQKVIKEYAGLLKDTGEGNGTQLVPDGTGGYTRTSNNLRTGKNAGKKMTKADWLAEAEDQLRAGKAESGHQKAFDEANNPEVQALLTKGEQTPAPEGNPIAVKQVTGIPVTDQTVVPQNLPETPGTVRPTTTTAPTATKSEAVAAQTPVALPKQTQDILDNPKQYNKRQVAAARNQRKLAKQLAKVQEDTQSVIANGPKRKLKEDSGTPGFVPTGEFRRGENGNVSEVAHGSTEVAQGAVDTANLSSGDVLSKANEEVAQGGRVSPESVRNLQAMLDSGRFPQTSPEYRAMAKTLYGAGSDYGRGLSLFNPTMRRTATGDQLTNRFVSKLYGVVEDGSKLTDSHIAAVSAADNTFTATRDAANQALDRYNATKSAEDFNAWKQARQAADDAEKHALITEYKVANEVLKGNKDPVALKAVQDAEKKAGVYQMDWIDANMLSGTGTATRNFVNTGLVRLENRMFGGRGYSSRGAKIGNKIGNRSVVTDFKARNELDQNVVSKTVKQWSTTSNTLGEGNINAVGSARAYKYYKDQLKSQGVAGDQLKRDTEVMLHSDPEKVAERYQQWALSENALSGLAHSKKLEQSLVEAIASKGGGKLSQTSAKAIVRLTVGFPTVIGRSLLGGVKRAGLGVPDLIAAGRQFAKGDSQAMKDALYAAKVHAGSGAALYALGTGLAEAGIISPSYPSDPTEQARWKSEGIQPNSIKIGGNWFSIPGYFGALALPLTIPANVINKTSPGDIAKGVVSGVEDLAPTAGIQNFIDGVEGRGGKQWVKNEVTSLTRAFTPVGSLLNQIAKMTDDTKNDTTTKDAIHNLLDSIASGIPGVNNKVDTIPATDANGNILHNPNPAATFFGAQGAEQKQGVEDTKQAQSTADDTYKQLGDYGVLGDKTLMGLVDKKIQAQIGRGQALKPEQIDSIRKAVIKGVSDTGEDTAYLEKGQYDTNLAALKVKRDLMSGDPTVKPSSLDGINLAIKRGGVYKDNQIPYDMIKSYESTSVDEWRKMGIPPGDKNYDPDAYDPETYQKLWAMDQLMTKAGVSYRKDHLDKNKYFVKDTTGSGKEPKQLDTSFGTLKDSKFAPTVQKYNTIDVKSGSVPHISVVRPNIVHKITSSG